MDAEEINKLAHLARINIDSTIVDDVARDITNILALVDQLQAVNTTAVVPMAHPLDARQLLRVDAVTETNQRDTLQAVAPAVENGLFLVPRVID